MIAYQGAVFKAAPFLLLCRIISDASKKQASSIRSLGCALFGLVCPFPEVDVPFDVVFAEGLVVVVADVLAVLFAEHLFPIEHVVVCLYLAD